ncbi:reverse transcriptase domain-containing protein [Tanacetum coccineum]
MSTHEQQTSTIPTSVVRNTGGKSGPQNLEEPASNEALRELCDKNYHQLLPLIAEKMQKEKEQQDKLKAVKARLLYGNESGRNPRNHEESHYSESKTPTARTEPRRRHGRKHSRSPSPVASVFRRLKQNRPPSPRLRPRKEGVMGRPNKVQEWVLCVQWLRLAVTGLGLGLQSLHSLCQVEEEGHTWMTPVYEYLTKEILPENKNKARVDPAACTPVLGTFPGRSRTKVKFLIVAIDYFTKWIEAKPVATITGNQVKKFVWDNIVCRFGLPGEIVSDNGKQFCENPFKDWCEKLSIRQCFASVKHPQTNGLVERANRSLGEGIKARLDERKAKD